MENKLQQLNSLIEFFKDRRKPTPKIIDVSDRLPSLIEELKIERGKFLEKNLPGLKKLISKNFKKLRISALSLMEYHWDENSHSNILQYLLDYNSFEHGAKLLNNIIELSLAQIEDDLSKKILKKSYSVYREYSIPTGRIDLLVVDEDEKFIIVIENKILAEIAIKTIVENENLKSVSQLENYMKWCEEEYPGFNKVYILLCFNDNDDNLFKKLSYKQIYEVLKEIDTTDNILDDYVLLLESLVNPIPQDLSELKKLSNKIIENENPEISLTDYYTLKTIYYDK